MFRHAFRFLPLYFFADIFFLLIFFADAAVAMPLLLRLGCHADAAAFAA